VPADVREQTTLFFRALAAGHDADAALSTRGHNQLVPDSGHLIAGGPLSNATYDTICQD
jgi:hypothetical protein